MIQISINISTDIKLLPLQCEDAAVIFELVQKSRVNLEKYLSWVDDVIDLKSTEKYISSRVNDELSNGKWYKIEFKGDICGVFAIKSVFTKTSIAEVGYWLDNTAHKKGIITSIIPFIPKYLKELGVKIMEFRCLTNNFASIRIATKSGAKLINSLPKYVAINNAYYELNIYQLRI